MSDIRKRSITAHISPYLGGLASETHQFVAYLNEEAARHKTRVRFVATANRIEAVGNLERAARSARTADVAQGFARPLFVSQASIDARDFIISSGAAPSVYCERT